MLTVVSKELAAKYHDISIMDPCETYCITCLPNLFLQHQDCAMYNKMCCLNISQSGEEPNKDCLWMFPLSC